MVGVLRGDLDPVVKSELGFGFELLTHKWIRPKYLDPDPAKSTWIRINNYSTWGSERMEYR